MSATLVGTTVGKKYVVQQLLGQGGMGAVYLAKNLQGQIVALKVIRPDLADDMAKRMFMEEAKTNRALSHPNIIRIEKYGYDQNYKLLYMVMEYLPNGDLWNYWNNRRETAAGASLSEAMTLLKGMAEGLDELHKEGVIHRDLKPQNVLLDNQKPPQPKIADFGLAKSRGDELTRYTRRLGTLLYMPPEQFYDAYNVSPQADLYALAAIAYYMICGFPPFLLEIQALTEQKNNQLAKEQAIVNALVTLNKDIQTRQKLVENWMQQAEAEIDLTMTRETTGLIVQDPPLLPSQLNLPAVLDDVLVLKGMAKSETERYKNAREFVVDLEKAVSTGVSGVKGKLSPEPSTPIKEKDLKNFDRDGRTSQEKLPEQIAIAAGAMALTAGAAVAGYQLLKRWRQTQQEKQSANPQSDLLILLKKWGWISPSVRTTLNERNLVSSDLTTLFLRIDTVADDANAKSPRVRVRVLANTKQRPTDETLLAERMFRSPNDMPDDIRRELTQQVVVERDLIPALAKILTP